MEAISAFCLAAWSLAGKDNPLFQQAGAAWPACPARAHPGGIPGSPMTDTLPWRVHVARAPCRTKSAERRPVRAARCL